MPFQELTQSVKKLQSQQLPAGQNGIASDQQLNDPNNILREIIGSLFKGNSDVTKVVNNNLSSILGNLTNTGLGLSSDITPPPTIPNITNIIQSVGNVDSTNGSSVDAKVQSVADVLHQDPISKEVQSKPSTGSYTATNPGANGYDPNNNYDTYKSDGFTTEYGVGTVRARNGLTHLNRIAAIGSDSVVDLFGKGSGIGGYRTRSQDSIANGDHPKGLGFDWGAPTIDQGEAVYQYQIANADRFGIKYVIFNGRIWNSGSGEKTYVPPPGEGNHSDHVHTSYYG
jgi:hypothetical protein